MIIRSTRIRLALASVVSPGDELMENPAEIASRLLRFEQQLKAYQKLHEDELAELWRSLNECKQIVATLCQEIENRPPPLSQSQPTLDA